MDHWGKVQDESRFDQRSGIRGCGLEGSIVLRGENLCDLFRVAKELDGDGLASEEDVSQTFPFHRPLGKVPDQHMANLIGKLGGEFGVDFGISFAAISDQHELSLGHAIDHSRDDTAFAFASQQSPTFEDFVSQLEPSQVNGTRRELGGLQEGLQWLE